MVKKKPINIFWQVWLTRWHKHFFLFWRHLPIYWYNTFWSMNSKFWVSRHATERWCSSKQLWQLNLKRMLGYISCF